MLGRLDINCLTHHSIFPRVFSTSAWKGRRLGPLCGSFSGCHWMPRREDDRSANLFPIIKWMDICPSGQNQPINHGHGFVRKSWRKERREIKRKPPCPFHAFCISQVQEICVSLAFGAKLESNGYTGFHKNGLRRRGEDRRRKGKDSRLANSLDMFWVQLFFPYALRPKPYAIFIFIFPAFSSIH